MPVPERTSSVVDQPPFTWRQLCILLGLSMLAAVIRLYQLGEWSFWVDEAHTYRDVMEPMETFMGSETAKYPLSYLLLRCLPESWLLSEYGMRLPFAFFGIASVPTLAIVSRRMVGPSVALTAALLLALSPWHIYWSQNARSYSMALFFSLLAMGMFFRGEQRHSVFTVLASLALFLVAGMCHPSALLLLGAVLIYIVMTLMFGSQKPVAWKRWSPLFVMVVLGLAMPKMLQLLERYQITKHAEFSLFHLLQTVAFYAGMPVYIAAVGGILLMVERGRRVGLLLATYIALPMLALTVLAVLETRVTAQYAFCTLPAFYLLAALLVHALAERFSAPGFRSMLLRVMPLGILLIHMCGQDFLYFKKEYGWRPRWREAAHYIRDTARRPVHLLTVNEPCMKYYLDPVRFKNTGQGNARFQIISMEQWDMYRQGTNPVQYLEEHLAIARKFKQDVWVVVTEPELYEKDRSDRADTFFRTRMHQVRRLPNWTGPRDMVVLIYTLPLEDNK